MSRRPIDPAIAGVGFSATAAAIFLPASIILAIVTLYRRSGGRSIAVPAAVSLGFAIVAVVVSRVVPAPDRTAPSIVRRSLLVGSSSCSVAIFMLVWIQQAVDPGPKTWLTVGLLAAAVGIGVVAIPIAWWLGQGERFDALVDAVTDRSSKIVRAPTSNASTLRGLAAVVVILVVVIAGLAVVLNGEPLGNDESAYALKARSWTEGTPSTGFSLHRQLGLPAVGVLVLQFSSSDVAFRAAAIGLSVVTLAIMWFVGSRMFTFRSATVGVVVFAISGAFLRRATEFLTDLIAAGLLLATLYVVWYHFERRPDRYWLVLAAPLAAGAYYFRYSAVLGLGVIALVGAVIWWKRLAGSLLPIAATAAVFILVTTPHFLYSREVTGSFLGLFDIARTTTGEGSAGYADYLRWLPMTLMGTVGFLAALGALAYAVGLVLTRSSGRWDDELRSHFRTVMYVLLVSGVFSIILGLTAHAERRFLFFPIMAGLLVGGFAAERLVSVLRPRVGTAVVVTAVVIAAVAFGSGVRSTASRLDDVAGSREVLRSAAWAVRHDVGGTDACWIRSEFSPQITWYSACATTSYRQGVPTSRPAYLLVFENARNQPTGTALDDEIAATSTFIVTIANPHPTYGSAHVYRY